MDPTVLAAVAGVIGAVIGAVLGGVFALKAAKRQVEVMVRHSRGDVNERLYNLKVLSTAEMVAGFMELVALQIEDQPAEIQPRWKAYIVDGYKSSVVLREHISDCVAWYADDFLHLLPEDFQNEKISLK